MHLVFNKPGAHGPGREKCKGRGWGQDAWGSHPGSEIPCLCNWSTPTQDDKILELEETCAVTGSLCFTDKERDQCVCVGGWGEGRRGEVIAPECPRELAAEREIEL